MDDADLTAEREERQAELARKYRRPAPALAATGACLFCGDELGDGLRFCDAHCRDDWQRRERSRSISGRPVADD